MSKPYVRGSGGLDEVPSMLEAECEDDAAEIEGAYQLGDVVG